MNRSPASGFAGFLLWLLGAVVTMVIGGYGKGIERAKKWAGSKHTGSVPEIFQKHFLYLEGLIKAQNAYNVNLTGGLGVFQPTPHT